MQKIEDLKNIYQNKRCIVIGNGPSLRDHDLSHILDEHIFVSNRFFMHDLWPKFTKANYFDICGFNLIPNPNSYLNPVRYDRWHYKGINKNKPMRYFFNKKYQHWFETLTNFPQDKCYYLDIIRDRTVYEGQFNFDISKGSYFSATTMVEGCMAVAQYMGFKEIYILGCDAQEYTWTQPYFYDYKQTPSRFWPKMKDNDGFRGMRRSWKTVSKLFPEKGIKVYNLSKKGKLDMFPRRDYEELFK